MEDTRTPEQERLTVPSVSAIYSSHELPADYVGNPLIEALPGILPHSEVIASLRKEPRFDASERNFSMESRLHFVARLFWDYFQPMEQHIRIWDYLSVCIRQGYIRRDPLKASSAERVNELYAAAMERRKPNIDDRGYIPNSVGFAIIGVSGVGKSTSVSAILNMYPQVITHTAYKGKTLDRKQIVWLKMDCPHKGSERGLCLNFLAQIDHLVGTNYYTTYEKRATVDTLLTLMTRIAASYSLGLLLVDELQHLASGKDTSKMLNFFVTLENTIGVPVVLMGTPGALPLLQADFRSARRCCAHGDIFWNPLKWDASVKNSEWELFLSRMWRFQWIRKPQKISPEYVRTMYEETQGIEALAVILFILLQEEALRNESETFDVDTIRKIAQKNMKIVQPMLNALRSNDPKKIAQYSDVISVFVDDFHSEHARNLVEDTAAGSSFQPTAEKIIIDLLTEMGLQPECAEKYALKALKEKPGEKPFVIARNALRMYDKDTMAESSREQEKAKAKQEPETDSQSDLRKAGCYDDIRKMQAQKKEQS